jgi:hypothetical protein
LILLIIQNTKLIAQNTKNMPGKIWERLPKRMVLFRCISKYHRLAEATQNPNIAIILARIISFEKWKQKK